MLTVVLFLVLTATCVAAAELVRHQLRRMLVQRPAPPPRPQPLTARRASGAPRHIAAPHRH